MKTKRDTSITIRIPEYMKIKLKQQAEELGMGVSALVMVMLESFFPE